jgi:hypothetical protein
MNTSKLIHTFFFMVVITLVALPNSTLAGGKPDKCGDGVCKGNETPATCEADCDGGGGGGEPLPVTMPDNMGQFGGGITETQFGTGNDVATNPIDLPNAPPRYCIAEVIQLNEGKVHHECEKGGLVTFNLSGWQNVAKNGNQGYCDLLDSGLEIYRQFTPTRFWFRNNAGCDFNQGNCEVNVSAWSYRGTETGDRHKYFDLSAHGLEDAGLTGFGGSAIIPTALGPNETGDGNPFADAQIWDLHKVSVNFKLAGKNKTVATCQVSWADGTLDQGEALFFTTPFP